MPMAQQKHPDLTDSRYATDLPEDFQIEASTELLRLWYEVFGSLHVRLEEGLPELRRRARTDPDAQRLGRVFMELIEPDSGKIGSRSLGWLLRKLSRYSHAGLWLHRDKDRGWAVRKVPRDA